MQVDASPLGVSCLIESLLNSQNPTVRDQVIPRLEQLDRDEEWLADLGARYRAVWEESVIGEAVDTIPTVSEETPLLLSWLVAQLRGPGDLAPLNAEIRTSVLREYHASTGLGVSPPAHILGIVVGTIGRPVSTIDQLLPALFPGDQVGPDVEAAYAGLVEHVQAAQLENWPEMHRTAVLWRLGAIAQGLMGGTDQVFESMRRLSASLAGALPLPDRRMTTDEWIKNYRGNRNGLTHVLPDGNGVGFNDALSQHMDVDSVLAYLRLAGYYTAAAINEVIVGLEATQAARWLPAVEADFSWVEFARK
jgi:hypothetical protein